MRSFLFACGILCKTRSYLNTVINMSSLELLAQQVSNFGGYVRDMNSCEVFWGHILGTDTKNQRVKS